MAIWWIASASTMVTPFGLFRALLVGVIACSSIALYGDTPPKIVVTISDGIVLEFTHVAAGSFEMGSTEIEGGEDEMPRHTVVVPAFYLGIYEVTQEQWTAVMGGNPSHFRGAKLPVETVSWRDCQGFIQALQRRTGLAFALPTEAQWEYACRAGSSGAWTCGRDENELAAFAWYATNAGGATHAVGTRKPNAWGLYDMHGNVAEWTADFYDKHAYAKTNANSGITSRQRGELPVIRGGAWGDSADMIRSAYRNTAGAEAANWGIGLRLVLLSSRTNPKLTQ